MDRIEIRNEQEYRDSVELLENAREMVGDADIHYLKPLIEMLCRAITRYEVMHFGDE